MKWDTGLSTPESASHEKRGTTGITILGLPGRHSQKFSLRLSCAKLRDMNAPEHTSSPSLKLLPAYLNTDSIAEALKTPRGRRILWLEIIVNDQPDWAAWRNVSEFEAVYQNACRWYTQYRRLITFLFNRAPLPDDSGPIDFRDYRTFAEALQFAYHHR